MDQTRKQRAEALLLNDIEIYDLAARFADRYPTSSIPPTRHRIHKSGDDAATAWLITLAHANRTETLPSLARELAYGAPNDEELQEVLTMLEARSAKMSRNRLEAWLIMACVAVVTTAATAGLLLVLMSA
ncbi:MAG: hypothetical protein HN348_31075 [Proteobacteria bacterium]|nr:hypothetical protein [Pseudomonadota bacterium]